MTVSNYGLYAVITPGNTKGHWGYMIYRDSYARSSAGANAVWDDTNVRTYGTCRTQARAEKKARKQIAKMVTAYDMLARKESTVE